MLICRARLTAHAIAEKQKAPPHTLSCMETTGRYWASHPNVRPRIEPGRIQCIAVGITDLWPKNEATLRAYSMQESSFVY